MTNVGENDWLFRRHLWMWMSLHKSVILGLPQSHFSIFKINQGDLLILEAIEGFLS